VNLKVAIISNLIYAAGYIGDFSTILKLFRNSKKDDVTYIKFGNIVIPTILVSDSVN
jgi:presenilin-like A22 family membrane protease